MKIYFNRPCPPEERRGTTNYCSFHRLVQDAGHLLTGFEAGKEKIDSIVIREEGIEFNIVQK